VCQRAAGGSANVSHPAFAATVAVAQKRQFPQDNVERETAPQDDSGAMICGRFNGSSSVAQVEA